MQLADGSMAAGHNGPHNHAESNVRNTANWLTVWLKAYQISAESQYKAAAVKAADYCLSDAARPAGGAFFNRHRSDDPRIDAGNGLIGQAWVLSAMTEAAPILEDERYLSLAARVFAQHKFDEELGLWSVLLVDGSFGSCHRTVNQQIWFALSGQKMIPWLSLQDANLFNERLNRFKLKLHNYVQLRADGILFHETGADSSDRQRRYERSAAGQHEHKLELGYHAFTSWGLVTLANYMGATTLSTVSPVIDGAVARLRSTQFQKMVDGDPFGYPYNPIGFEAANILLSNYMTKSKPEQDYKGEAVVWIKRQLDRHFRDGLMQANTEDAHTLAARICEARDLLDKDLDIELLTEQPAE